MTAYAHLSESPSEACMPAGIYKGRLISTSTSLTFDPAFRRRDDRGDVFSVTIDLMHRYGRDPDIPHEPRPQRTFTMHLGRRNMAATLRDFYSLGIRPGDNFGPSTSRLSLDDLMEQSASQLGEEIDLLCIHRSRNGITIEEWLILGKSEWI